MNISHSGKAFNIIAFILLHLNCLASISLFPNCTVFSLFGYLQNLIGMNQLFVCWKSHSTLSNYDLRLLETTRFCIFYSAAVMSTFENSFTRGFDWKVIVSIRIVFDGSF